MWEKEGRKESTEVFKLCLKESCLSTAFTAITPATAVIS